MTPNEPARECNVPPPSAAAEAPCSEQDDPRVTHAALEYLDGLRAGRRPDRQQFLARHPDIAAALAECLDGLEFIHAAAPQLHHSAVGPPAGPATGPRDLPPSANLGDYRILREIGRGGMGIVYEAEQLSLGRRVALKVLPFAATLDQKQLQRFKNEAQAAAGLHHPNIVPVYAVGCERGVHYYAMQFIDGQTLARLIRERRQLAGLEAPDAEACSAGQATGPYVPLPNPGQARTTEKTQAGAARSTERSATGPAFFRTVATLGSEAALALEHAHQLGVVHRDIKPANLLLDGGGRLWVTDFGLAHVQSQAGLTMTGDLVGTLRYMSPEQALAKPVIVDQRTDVYSLGVTLYELLTLEPAFPGRDRQELLCRIATEAPRPPRRLDAAIPPDLETIVLKAMSKEPEGRYATAQDLAEDLRRFLEDKPINARRPSLGQRAAKWARRHKVVVVCAAVVLVVTSLALALSTVLIQAARLNAIKQRNAARRAVDDMYTDVAERWLEQEPEMEEVQREFLLKALRYYEDFSQEPGSDPAVRFATALAYRRVGDIQQKLGDFSRAEPAYTEAVRLLTRLAEDFRSHSEYRAALALCHHNLGGLLAQVKRHEEAEGALRRAVALREQLVQEAPGPSQPRYDLAASATALGRVLHSRGRPQGAQEQYRLALGLLEGLVGQPTKDGEDSRKAEAGHAFGGAPVARVQQDAASLNLLAATQGHLADLHSSGGQLAQTRQLLQRAIGHQRRALKLRPRHPVYQKYLAVQLASLGRTLVHLEELAEAEAVYRQALAFQEKLAQDFPRRPQYRSDLASFTQEMGDVLTARGRREEARQAYAQALAIRKQLVQELPASPGHCRDLAWLLATCPDPHLQAPDQAVRLARQAVALAPRGPDCWRALGVACYRAGDWQVAVTALRKAMALRSGGDGWEWFFLAMARWQLGDRQQARACYERGRRWTEDRPKASGARRAQAEAAALLGLTGRQAAPKQQGTGRDDPE
jgi:serine/threonine protein kinase/uncharacterized protein HemY